MDGPPGCEGNFETYRHVGGRHAMIFLVISRCADSLAFIVACQVREIRLFQVLVAIPSLLLGEWDPPRAAKQIAQKPGDGWYAGHDAQQG